MIDLNSDVGEGFGAWSIGADAAIIPLVTSVNVACGFHAGDPGIMRATALVARDLGVAVGAHPGYPDLQGFGRRPLALSPSEIEDIVVYQLGALLAFARALDVALVHVKPHGALYNRAARDHSAAGAIATAIASVDPSLILVGLANSALIDVGVEQGLAVAREAFADRAYEVDGSLRARDLPGAVHGSVEQVVDQALSIARDGVARAHTGEQIPVVADTICLHGDTPGALEFAGAVRSGLERAGVPVRPLREVLRQRGQS